MLEASLRPHCRGCMTVLETKWRSDTADVSAVVHAWVRACNTTETKDSQRGEPERNLGHRINRLRDYQGVESESEKISKELQTCYSQHMPHRWTHEAILPYLPICFLFIKYICVCVCVYVHVCMCVYMLSLLSHV